MKNQLQSFNNAMEEVFFSNVSNDKFKFSDGQYLLRVGVDGGPLVSTGKMVVIGKFLSSNRS